MEDNKKSSNGIVPLLVFFFIIVIANVFLFVWLIPKMMAIFNEMYSVLPPPAKLVFSMSVFFRRNIYLLLPIIILGSLGSAAWAKTTRNKGKSISVMSSLAIALFIFGGIAFIFTFLPLFHNTVISR
jgi:type II secretory pathway component PulF